MTFSGFSLFYFFCLDSLQGTALNSHLPLIQNFLLSKSESSLMLHLNTAPYSRVSTAFWLLNVD